MLIYGSFIFDCTKYKLNINTNDDIINPPNNVVNTFINFSSISLPSLLINAYTNLFNIIEHIITNIVDCLFEYNINKISPPSINKSTNLIFISVNVNNAINIINTHSTSTQFTNVIGKCSFMFCVVFPCIVFTKYVYGVVPNGVTSPVNTHIIITITKYFTPFLLVNTIL